MSEKDPRMKTWTNTMNNYRKLLLTCTPQEKEWYQKRIQSCERLLSNVE